jgi:hypothetical protein
VIGERREVAFTDELMADGGVHRSYADGRQEWRWLREGGVVQWRDDRGDSGTDELLGRRIVKRVSSQGRVVYARELGYGRTVWGRGELITINRTSFGGRVGAIIAGLGAGLLLGPVLLPPQTLTPDQEEELRRHAEQVRRSGENDDGFDLADAGGWGDDDDFG